MHLRSSRRSPKYRVPELEELRCADRRCVFRASAALDIRGSKAGIATLLPREPKAEQLPVDSYRLTVTLPWMILFAGRP